MTILYALFLHGSCRCSCLPRRILGARGRTELHWAAKEGHAAVVEQLISAGAKVDAADNKGRGPGRVFGSFWEWL